MINAIGERENPSVEQEDSEQESLKRYIFAQMFSGSDYGDEEFCSTIASLIETRRV